MPWTGAHQASLSFATSQNSLKLMSIELVMLSNHLILCHLLLLLPSIFPSIWIFPQLYIFLSFIFWKKKKKTISLVILEIAEWCGEEGGGGIREKPMDCKEIKPVHPKGDQSWIFIWRTDVEPETPIVLPSDAKSWLIWKDPDAGKDWRQEEKGKTKNEMVG